jgi:EpsI family protein
MHNGKILGMMTLLMLVVAVVACRLVPRLGIDARLLPVDRLPRRIEGWTAGPDLTTEPAVQARLPTAHILERNYTNEAGTVANVMLLTATDDEDFHKPTACLPAQGWTLRERTAAEVGGRPVNVVIAQREHQGFTIYYYWVKLKRASPPRNSLLAAALALRRHVAHEDMALFVRVALPDDPQYRADLQQFSDAIWNSLRPILGSEGEVVMRS